jgi:hypothetical protein
MSRSTLYQVFRTTTREVAEYKNSWGSAPALWNLLGKEYLGQERAIIMQDARPLWRLASDPRVPTAIRMVHAFTFDLALCPIGRVAELAAACDKAYSYVKKRNPETVNHWQAIAGDLRVLAKKHDYRCIGAGLGCTSVNDPWESWITDPWDLFQVLETDSVQPE